MKETYTEEEMREAHGKSGECRSCGWHALYHEHDYNLTNNDKCPNEYWDTCQNSESSDEEVSGHRGCYIYPEKTNHATQQTSYEKHTTNNKKSS